MGTQAVENMALVRALIYRNYNPEGKRGNKSREDAMEELLQVVRSLCVPTWHVRLYMYAWMEMDVGKWEGIEFSYMFFDMFYGYIHKMNVFQIDLGYFFSVS